MYKQETYCSLPLSTMPHGHTIGTEWKKTVHQGKNKRTPLGSGLKSLYEISALLFVNSS